jgi:threonine dehydratase
MTLAMSNSAKDATGSIGDTPMVELTRAVPPGHARVLVKLESQNPTGSMKDRMALSVVERAAASGRLASDGMVVEYTGGSTGTSLAFVCAARGYGSGANVVAAIRLAEILGPGRTELYGRDNQNPVGGTR